MYYAYRVAHNVFLFFYLATNTEKWQIPVVHPVEYYIGHAVKGQHRNHNIISIYTSFTVSQV